jgi:hypothetical protein
LLIFGIDDGRLRDCRLSDCRLAAILNRQSLNPFNRQSSIDNPAIANRQSTIRESPFGNRQSAIDQRTFLQLPPSASFHP